MRLFHLKWPGMAVLGTVLAGCAGGANYYVQTPPGYPVSHQALADEVYLDGTGPVARHMAAAPGYATERRQAEPQPTGVTKPVVRTRPTAIPRDQADNISASTTGARGAARDDVNKPFSEAWWERERQEDARLRAKMNICRGC